MRNPYCQYRTYYKDGNVYSEPVPEYQKWERENKMAQIQENHTSICPECNNTVHLRHVPHLIDPVWTGHADDCKSKTFAMPKLTSGEIIPVDNPIEYAKILNETKLTAGDYIKADTLLAKIGFSPSHETRVFLQQKAIDLLRNNYVT